MRGGCPRGCGWCDIGGADSPNADHQLKHLVGQGNQVGTKHDHLPASTKRSKTFSPISTTTAHIFEILRIATLPTPPVIVPGLRRFVSASLQAVRQLLVAMLPPITPPILTGRPAPVTLNSKSTSYRRRCLRADGRTRRRSRGACAAAAAAPAALPSPKRLILAVTGPPNRDYAQIHCPRGGLPSYPSRKAAAVTDRSTPP